MKHPINDENNAGSFNLNRDVNWANQNFDAAAESAPTWQERAYESLKVLYGVSKLLSYSHALDTTFPKVIELCATVFHIDTAVLIEKRGKILSTVAWNAKSVAATQLDFALSNAKESFVYLTGNTMVDSGGRSAMPSSSAESSSARKNAETSRSKNYVVLPLVIDTLPAFGILQIEWSVKLDEKDLEFMDALANLIAVAVDRQHKTERELQLKEFEARESSQKLSKANADVSDLEAERELRESFVSLLTHDLRTPLAAISMSAQLIEMQKEQSKATLGFAARISKNVQRADQMISDLLDANLLRTGEPLPVNIEKFDLKQVVEQTIEELTLVHGNRFVLDSSDSVEGYWDKKGLRRIVENLSNNAVKYGSLKTPINVTIRATAENAIIEVQNSGEPISIEDQKSLFHQFKRVQNAESGKNKGWGIGLTLVKGVAEAHGGNVRVLCEPGRGTVFIVSLPRDSRIVLSKH